MLGVPTILLACSQAPLPAPPGRAHLDAATEQLIGAAGDSGASMLDMFRSRTGRPLDLDAAEARVIEVPALPDLAAMSRRWGGLGFTISIDPLCLPH